MLKRSRETKRRDNEKPLRKNKRRQLEADFNFTAQILPIQEKENKGQKQFASSGDYENGQSIHTNFEEKQRIVDSVIIPPPNPDEFGLKTDDIVTLEGKKITLALNFGNSRFEPKICYREFIVFSWVKSLLRHKHRISYTLSRHEAVEKIKVYARKNGFKFYDNHRLIGPAGVRKALNRMRREKIIEVTIRAKKKLNEITIKSALINYKGASVLDSFRYYLARSYTSLHRTAKSKRSDEILELIDAEILPKSIDGYHILKQLKTKPKSTPFWESTSGTIKYKEILKMLYNHAQLHQKLPRDSEFRNWLIESIKGSDDYFEITSGELKLLLSSIGKDFSTKYHATKEHFKNGQHSFLELINKKFSKATRADTNQNGSSYIHPKLNGGKITRWTMEQSSGNKLFVSGDMNGFLPDGRKINVITKGSSKQNLAWQTLEQSFLNGVRIVQFINEDKKHRTNRIISVIIDDTVESQTELKSLNISNMIFHDILKKGAAIPSTRKEFLTRDTLDAVFHKTIKSYGTKSIEYELWKEFQKEFSDYFKGKLEDSWILTRDEFEAFWITLIYSKIKTQSIKS